jgi:type II pantothenate kinase
MSNPPIHSSKTPGAGPLVPFCKLKDVGRYLACPWDLVNDENGRNHWVPFFRRHLNTILKFGVEAAVAQGGDEADANARAEGCRRELYQKFDSFLESHASAGRVDILTLDRWRDGSLRRWGFTDAFAELKNRENEKMLPLLPGVCAQIDSLPPENQLTALVLGILAGNMFDMGQAATSKAFLADGSDFFAARSNLSPRPWLIDDFDRLSQRMQTGPIYRKAVFFLDNAGGDFLLGAVPMVRWLARRGTRIVLAANDRPSLNDMTLVEVLAWWPRIVAIEPSLSDLPIEHVSTGTSEPLIDLSAVSPDLNAAAQGADLVILEGMGRGVESNLDAEFSCNCLKLAMIKDAFVAARLGGKLYDVVCRFRE